MKRLHPFLQIDPYKDLLEEIEPLRGLSADQTAWMVSAVCASARSIADARPDRDVVLEFEDPVPESSRILWRALRARKPCRVW